MRGSNGWMKVVISSEARLLAVLRGVVRYIAGRWGFPEADVDSLAAAVDEAAAGAMRSAQGNRPGRAAALEIRMHPDHLEFFVEGSAPSGHREAAQPPRFEDARTAGPPDASLQRVTDSALNHEHSSTGIRIVKHFPRKVSEPDES